MHEEIVTFEMVLSGDIIASNLEPFQDIAEEVLGEDFLVKISNPFLGIFVVPDGGNINVADL